MNLYNLLSIFKTKLCNIEGYDTMTTSVCAGKNRGKWSLNVGIINKFVELNIKDMVDLYSLLVKIVAWGLRHPGPKLSREYRPIVLLYRPQNGHLRQSAR